MLIYVLAVEYFFYDILFHLKENSREKKVNIV